MSKQTIEEMDKLTNTTTDQTKKYEIDLSVKMDNFRLGIFRELPIIIGMTEGKKLMQ